jgi:hypothetical protein
MQTAHDGFKQCARGEHSLVIAILANSSIRQWQLSQNNRQCNVPHEDPRI